MFQYTWFKIKFKKIDSEQEDDFSYSSIEQEEFFHSFYNKQTDVHIYNGSRLKLSEFNTLFLATMNKICIPETQKDIILDFIRLIIFL